MPRVGVEYEEVAAVASRLRASGVADVKPRMVLAETGGSMSTIHKHLKRWNGENPRAAAPPPELPQTLQRALQTEFQRAQDEARADLQERLATAQQEAEDLARESDR
jgi:hypothetical protein